MLRLTGKVLKTRIKTRRACGYFTLCLPGSPKVNAGGACGAWLPGRELLRISASTIASREQVASSALRPSPSPASPSMSRVPELAAFASATFDELVQWMLEDAS